MNPSTTAPIRWGVAGCGQIAVDKTIPGLLQAAGAHLVAIADPLEPRRNLALGLAAAAGVDGVRVYDYDTQLFEDPEIDAVYIAIPTGQHAASVLAAAGAGKAILCEKPLGRSAGEVGSMVLAARDHGVRLSTGYMSRFSDVFGMATEIVRGGRIGKVTFVDANFSYPCMAPYPPGAPGGWRWTDPDGGGPLLDVGVYLAFGIREILGDRIAEVTPVSLNTIAPAESVISDTSAAVFVTEGGIPGVFVTTFSHAALYLNFHGTEGSLSLSDLFFQTSGARLELTRNGVTEFVLDTRDDPDLAHNDNYRREFEHFSSALTHGTPHSPTPDDVLADALLLDSLKAAVPSITVPTPAEYLS